MIIDRIRRITIKEQQADNIKRFKVNAKQAKATLEELEQVAEGCRKLEYQYRVIVSRLLPTFAPEFQAKIAPQVAVIQKLRERFETNSNQLLEIKRLANELRSLTDHLNQAWSSWIKQQYHPYQELFRLVQDLPEIKIQERAIQDLFGHLNAAKAIAPHDIQELNRIDQRIVRLAGYFSSVRGLSPEVQAFLHKVREGQATIADLSPEILTWCTSFNHAHAFKIRF
jgi:hypothetical protein